MIAEGSQQMPLTRFRDHGRSVARASQRSGWRRL